jgi:L-threonylcarbamoyladenylate synthase
MASRNDAGYAAPPEMPRVLVLDPARPDATGIGEAARALRQGKLVAFPTETVYGLGARAFDETAIERVFRAKGRPAHHPLIAHVTGEGEARALASSWPRAASLLAEAFWPGPVTVVVDRAPGVPASLAGGGGSIAIRAPAHPVALALLAALGEPIAAPSANRYQSLSPTTAAHVVKQLGDAVDLVLDGGACDAGIESTVVDVRGPSPRVLRPGALGLAELRRVLPGIGLDTTAESAGTGAARASPGMDARHYTPRAPLHVAESWEGACRMAQELASRRPGAGPIGLVVYGAAPAPTAAVVHRVLSDDPALYARRLYDTLHGLDDAGVAAIVVQRVPPGEGWWAVADRLRRATAPRAD